MRARYWLIGWMTLTGLSLTAEEQDARRQQIASAYGKLPLSFEANRGQSDRRVDFLSRGNGYTLFLTPSGAMLSMKGDAKHGAALGLKLAGANRQAEVSGADALPGTANYFTGSNPAQWHTGIPTYGRVNYRRVYPGIDLTYYGNQRQLEYDFVVGPGADPGVIALEFQGADRLHIDAQGDLVLDVAGRQVRQHKPVVYQEIAGARQALEGRYVQRGRRTVGFAIARYDRGKPLIIDPILTLAYSTYLGGSNFGQGNGIAADSAGNAYVTGFTDATDFPTTPGAFQTTQPGNGDAFVTKLNPSGTALVYSTYLGGSGDDEGLGIAVDLAGHAYVTGDTNSTNFPTTPGAFQTTPGGGFQEAFVTKLNAAGTALVYSTYLGGVNTDQGNGIAVDSSQNAYVTGYTFSPDFPTTPGAFQTTLAGSPNAFVTRLNAAGTALVYSTFLGGSGNDAGKGIAVDLAGNAYVTGDASSPDFPTTPGAFQTALRGSLDAFVTKLNPSGTALVYSTYLGGSGGDEGNGIAVDSAGSAYVTGDTNSADFPTTPGAFQTTQPGGGGSAAFVTKLNGAGAKLVYSTFLGGSNPDQGNGIAVDSSQNAYVTGYTSSPDFPTTPGAFQTTLAGDPNAFVTRLNAAGKALVYSTFLGGTADDSGKGITLDPEGNAYVTGIADSPDFPTTPGAFQTRYGGDTQAFVAKFQLVEALIGYAANLKAGDSHVNLSNAGSVNGFDPAGDICANVYVFGEDQQLIECCTCPLTPDHLKTLSAQSDLISNTLTPGVPIGITIMLVASTGTCNASGVTAATIAPGLLAWGTTLHAAPGGGFTATETPFSNVSLSDTELLKLTSTCGFIQANGSNFGICNSCKEGAAGAKRQ